MPSKYVYVTQQVDWADEFDVYGCFVTTRKEANSELRKIKKAFADNLLKSTDEYYFGTNEAVQFNDYEDFADTLTVDGCSDEFAEEFRKLNNGLHFGTTFISDLLERADDRKHSKE